MSNSKYQIFDNFLEDPDEVLEYASTCQYFTAEEYQKIDPLESVGKWPGLRSNDLQLEFPDITHKLNKMFNVRVGWLTFYQHLVSQNIGKPIPHTDVRWDFSGVIYLKGSDGTWIDNEIVPFGDFKVDKGPRRGTTMEKMAELRTLAPEGRLTAATSSQISDGAAALLIVSEKALKEHGFKPRARIHHLSVRGDDPIWMLTAPIPATEYALKKTGMSLDDMDVIEINEAFASVVLAWQKETGADLSKVNINGGAMSLGHPLGATGARLMTTMLNELERSGGKYGFQTMCEGGGQANVTIIERL